MKPRVDRLDSTVVFVIHAISRAVITIAAITFIVPTVADVPPSCTGGGGLINCDLATEYLKFNTDEPGYEIVAVITDCTHCTDPDVDGMFHIQGTAEVEFGPYPMGGSCPEDGDIAVIVLNHDIRPYEDPHGTIVHYHPNDANADFEADAPDVSIGLHTDCVDATWLHYEIPKVLIRDSNGAHTDDVGGSPSTLVLPDSVRSTSGNRLQLGTHRLTQGLTFQHIETNGDPNFRFWPEGMPFRLGAGVVTASEAEVVFDTATAPGPVYDVVPPSEAGMASSQLIHCQDPEFGEPCTTTQVWNAGYFDSTHWLPANTRFDRDGMDVDLALGVGHRILYQPLFPQGATLRLDGPATVSMLDGLLQEGGSFAGGKAWLEIRDGGPCNDPASQRTFDLNAAPMEPRLTPDGGILAGLTDLTPPDMITWTYNRVGNLGCGTLYLPPVVNDVLAPPDQSVGPQAEWLSAADVPGSIDNSNGRGLYAGFNYNRNRVCDNDTTRRCGDDGDCIGGGVCVVDIWSPLCPAASGTPVWYSRVNAQDPDPFTAYPIDPSDTAQEMALYARASGITGVFDSGPVDVTIGDDSSLKFELGFDRFGLTFRASRSEGMDTVVQGGLYLPWPSETTVPFGDMGICDCGATSKASVGAPVENRLRYWDARFYPYSLTFQKDDTSTCTDSSENACHAGTSTPQQVCIEATTPIPHFQVRYDGAMADYAPDPISEFDVTPDGNPGEILPLSSPWFEFEWRAAQLGLTPYTMEIETIPLSPWDVGIGECDVYNCGGPTAWADFGYYDAEGNLDVPFFGLTPSGIKIQRDDPDLRRFLADLHRKGDVDTDYIVAERKMAADTLGLKYRLDYYRPSETAMDDGSNYTEGRGLLLGNGWHVDQSVDVPRLDLGSISVASSVVIDPNDFADGIIQSDLGPAGAMRLWGATTATGRAKLVASGALPAGYDAEYTAALNEIMAATTGRTWDDLPWPGALHDLMTSTAALWHLQNHPDNSANYNTSPPLDPGIHASNITGFLLYEGLPPDTVSHAFVKADLDTGGNFFEFKRSELTVDRHIKSSSPDQPICQLGRDASQPGNMKLPGKMDVPFPSVPGMQWDFDYIVNPGPSFQFNSLTGSLDLTQGALGAMGFDEAGMTLKYWADGDWYFDAGLKLKFNGYGAYGNILAGNTKDLTPLRALDPTVADFIGNVPSFNGGYARVGVQGRIFNYGCLLRVSAGMEVGGWYITDSYGGKLRGWVSGRGACLVSVRGDLTLLGGEVGDKFKMQGSMWVAGGIGFCDEEDWDCPADVLDDDFCIACVVSGSITGITPPKFKLSMEGPNFECAL